MIRRISVICSVYSLNGSIRNILSFFDRAQALLDSLSFVTETRDVLPLIVFLDLQMPEIDGYTALLRIKQANLPDMRWADVPVVIYSSYSDQDVIQRCLDAGAIAFL